MASHALIVASNRKYLPGLTALIGSLKAAGNTHPLHILGYKLPDGYPAAVEAAGLPYPVTWHPISEREASELGEADVLLRKRYALPAELDADSVCVLDADMYVCRSLDRQLEITAATDLILGCGQEQKKRYDHPNYRLNGRWVVDPEKPAYRDLCAVPLFVGRRWYETLALSWRRYVEHRWRANDMDALNLCLIEAGAYDRIWPLSQQVWTGPYMNRC